MCDLVQVEVPREVVLYAPVVTKDNVDAVPADRASSPDRLRRAGCLVGAPRPGRPPHRLGQRRDSDMTTAGTPAVAGGDDRATPSWAPPTRRPGAPPRTFFDLPLRPEMAARRGPRRRRVGRGRGGPARLGVAPRPTGGACVARDDIDLVDICTPGDTHAEIAIAALEAGKHVLCEKPLANTVAEAEAMVGGRRAAAGHGVRSMVGFTYRRVPAIALARQLVAEGTHRRVRHVRAQYLQDWLADPEAPLTWRLEKEQAGSGALGDIGAHIIDLTQFITGAAADRGVRAARDLRQASGRCAAERGAAGAGIGGTAGDGLRPGHRRRRGGLPRPARLGGALGAFEATRFATGRKNAIRIEINGSRGQPRVRLRGHERPASSTTAAAGRRNAGFTRILVTEPTHPYVAAGGRPATASATSTASPTRWSTW